MSARVARRAALLLLGAALAGCSGHEPTIAPDTAVVQIGQEPDTLNPYLSPMRAVSDLASLCYAGLVTLDPAGEFRPDLAERVPTRENGGVTVDAGGRMRVTYALRPNARWHDGRPVTSADVAATLDLVRDPSFPSVSTAGYDRILKVETPDPRTAVVVYDRPYAPYLELFPYLLPAHVLAAAPKGARQKGGFNLKPVGAGPFKLASWDSGERLRFTAFDGYFRGKPALAAIEARVVPSEPSAFGLWKAGQIDVLQSATAPSLPALRAHDAGHVFAVPGAVWEHLVFNLERPAVKDARVRHALAALVDRRALMKGAYELAYTPAYGDLPPASWAHTEPFRAVPTGAATADAELRAAGYALDDRGVRRGPTGEPLTLALVTTSDSPNRERAALILRSAWRKAGVAVSIEKWPASKVFGTPEAGGILASGKFDVALVASVARPDPDASYRWRSDQVPPEGQNRSRYRDPAVDALCDAGQRALARAERKAIYAKLSAKLAADLPVLPLVYPTSVTATSARLRHYAPNPTLRGNLWNAWAWTLAEPGARASDGPSTGPSGR